MKELSILDVVTYASATWIVEFAISTGEDSSKSRKIKDFVLDIIDTAWKNKLDREELLSMIKSAMEINGGPKFDAC